MGFLTSFMIYLTSSLLLALISIRVIADNDDNEQHLLEQRRQFTRGIIYRRRQPVCVHGYPNNGGCECEENYTGQHCEKQKHCATFRRFRNGSCPSCLPGYHGEHCEEIHCVHGEPSKLETKCECEAPFSGTFCDELSTGHVYGYYNRRVYWLGPLGALTLIPMCILYVGCEYMAKKRRVR
ncbi:hypothetical protein Angca_001165, partial [Angiostrongylus cantonensis]